MNADTLRDVASRLMHAIGALGDLTIEPLNGGANNQVFKLTAGDRTAVLKAYFQHPDDPRDRLDSEYRFTTFAWTHGVRRVPQPLAREPRQHAALYEHVDGRRVTIQDLDGALVTQALEFFHALNAIPRGTDSAGLPLASEAYFTLGAHLQGVAERVRRLENLDERGEVGQAAAQFVEELTDTWHQVAADVRNGARGLGIQLDAELAPEARRLSPSDFGFHNAILEPEGCVRFVDFEYAGWDDPAKLVCDFFCQEAVPVPERHFEWFAAEAVRDLPDAAVQRTRIDLLLPVYRIKWCCILLNEFLPVGRDRRRFTQSGGDEHRRKSAQLDKARRAIQRIAAA